jgi:hypothetical protein
MHIIIKNKISGRTCSIYETTCTHAKITWEKILDPSSVYPYDVQKFICICGDPAYHCMCSMQVVDITLMKHRLTSITSTRVVQQKHRRSTVCL